MKDSIFVLTDNKNLYRRFYDLLVKKEIIEFFDFYCSPDNSEMQNIGLEPINLLEKQNFFLTKYKIGFSIHSKQMFPKKLVNTIQCFNVHPGYNPYNRGWYPQVFAIIEDNRIGATLHKMDEKLDNGDIIDRIEVEKYIWDTSETLYNRVLDAEIEMLNINIINVIEGNYSSFRPEFEGRLYLRNDFNNLCEINLDEKGSFYDFFNRLRALSHGNYSNAYIIEKKTNRKVYLKLIIEHHDD